MAHRNCRYRQTWLLSNFLDFGPLCFIQLHKTQGNYKSCLHTMYFCLLPAVFIDEVELSDLKLSLMDICCPNDELFPRHDHGVALFSLLLLATWNLFALSLAIFCYAIGAEVHFRRYLVHLPDVPVCFLCWVIIYTIYTPLRWKTFVLGSKEKIS